MARVVNVPFKTCVTGRTMQQLKVRRFCCLDEGRLFGLLLCQVPLKLLNEDWEGLLLCSHRKVCIHHDAIGGALGGETPLLGDKMMER